MLCPEDARSSGHISIHKDHQMNEKIIAALKQLDVANDSHWTSDGSPRLAALKLDGITREQVAAVAPQFTRTNPSIDPPAVIEEKVVAVKAKEKPVDRRAELEVELGLAQEALAAADEASRKANLDYRKASAQVDGLMRALAAYDQSNAGQQDIMDYIAKSNERRMAQAMEKQATQKALAEFMATQRKGA